MRIEITHLNNHGKGYIEALNEAFGEENVKVLNNSKKDFNADYDLNIIIENVASIDSHTEKMKGYSTYESEREVYKLYNEKYGWVSILDGDFVSIVIG